MSRDWPPGRFLELGAGNGDLTRYFADRGFEGACYDLGADTREHLRKVLADTDVEVVDELEGLDQSFDYLFAFEVLEHIPDDAAALRTWVRALRPGGKVLVSVPAHQHKFGPADERVGHVRRYERDDLVALLRSASVEPDEVRCWGFPLGNISRRLSRGISPDVDAATPEERSIRSGVETSAQVNRLAKAVNGWTLAPFRALQRPFESRDIGEGYVVTGIFDPGRQ